jgi:F420-dependent oxidoreductase-like protein
VVEGWYGEPYPRPLERTREFIDIVRQVWAREKPVTFQGNQYQIPYQGGSGLGKALKSTVHPLRADIPIYLGAEGPKNVALSAELCDGWLPLFFAPRHDAFYVKCLKEGFARPGARRSLDDFDIAVSLSVVIDADVEAAADRIRPMLALYMGGMGARDTNFHFDVFARMGYEDVAVNVQELYLAGKKAEAIASIPTALCEEVALIGPPEKIRDDLAMWEDSCVTTLLLGGPPKLLRTMADLVRG